MRSLSGRNLGAYRLIEQVGLGGMAIVYKAYDPGLDRYIAIKILPEYLGHDDQFSARFQREARSVARLRHPNILPIYGYGEEDELRYFVMDLVQGGTLKELMASLLPMERAVSLIVQIAAALQYAHGQGIVHRDVKPANVLMAAPDWPVLSDFGIARVLEGTEAMTRSAFLGTPHYMAPEQARGEPVGPATDQYALGIVLYEMLTGSPPYHADTPQAVAYQHIYASLPLPREKNPLISDAMERVILKALAKDPADRFPDMAAFANAVRAATGGVVTEPVHPPPDAPVPVAATSSTATHGASSTVKVEPPVAAAVVPVKEQERPSAPWRPLTANRGLLGVGAGVVVALILAGGILLNPFGAAKSVRLTVLAPSGVSALPTFNVYDSGGSQMQSVTPTGSSANVSLKPGQYALDFQDGAYAERLPVTVTASGSQVISLDRRFGRLVLLPPAHRVTASGYNLYPVGTQRNVGGVDASHATSGVYVLPGRYSLIYYDGQYVVSSTVSIAAGHTATLNLAQTFGLLRILPLKAHASGFNMGANNAIGATADQARAGIYVPPGRYTLQFYSSLYNDPLGVTVAAGGETTIDLNRRYAPVIVPAQGTNNIEYTWREGNAVRTLDTGAKAQLVYILAGIYRVQVSSGGATGFITLQARPGHTARLPDHV